MAFPPQDGSDPSRQAPAVPGLMWFALLAAVVTPTVVGYFGVVRPTTTQLGLVRGQVARLEATLHDLRAKTPTAGRSVGLLTRLAELEGVAARAERSLHRVDRLQDRVARSVARAEQTAAALDQLDELRERIAAQTAMLEEANGALSTLAGLPAEIEASIDLSGRAMTAVKRVRELRDRAAEADRLAVEALSSVDTVVVTQEMILSDVESLESAHDTLGELTRLESRLNAPLMAVEQSHERLDDLVRLKDAVVDRTADLPAAFETFELMVDITADYHRASAVLRPMQRLMADLVLLEPSIARLATVAQPIMQQAKLSELGGTELRLVLKELRQRHAEAVAQMDETQAVATRPDGTATK